MGFPSQEAAPGLTLADGPRGLPYPLVRADPRRYDMQATAAGPSQKVAPAWAYKSEKQKAWTYADGVDVQHKWR